MFADDMDLHDKLDIQSFNEIVDQEENSNNKEMEIQEDDYKQKQK